jgi:hypothetical protein
MIELILMTKLKLKVWILLLQGVFGIIKSLNPTIEGQKNIEEADKLIGELKAKLEEYRNE